MTNLKRLDPKDIDESLVRLVEFSGNYYVLFPFVDATGDAPTYRSLGHSTPHESLKFEDLAQVSKAMQTRAQDAVWFILFSMPWLLRLSDADAIRKPAEGRR